MLQKQRADRQSPGQTRKQEGSFVRTFEVTDRHAPKWVTTHERNYCRHKVTKIVVTLTPAPQHHHHHHNLVASTKRGINLFDYGLKESLLVSMWCVVILGPQMKCESEIGIQIGFQTNENDSLSPQRHNRFSREREKNIVDNKNFKIWMASKKPLLSRNSKRATTALPKTINNITYCTLNADVGTNKAIWGSPNMLGEKH